MKMTVNIMITIGIISFFGCNLNTNNAQNSEIKSTELNKNEKNIEEPVKEIVVESENIVEKGKVIHMNKTMFLEKVMDYNANPDKWVFKGDKPCIIDFYASWCGPCKKIAPIMDQLAKEYAGEIDIYKVNVDAEKELASVFNVRSIPAILYVPKNSQPQIFTGAFDKAKYVQLINEILIVK